MIFLNGDDSYDLLNKHTAFEQGKLLNPNYFFRTFLITRLIHLLPIFSFFVHSSGKNSRKFSKGKSGKYSFV